MGPSIREVLAQLDPNTRRMFQRFLKAQRVAQVSPYYSTISFVGTRQAGEGPPVYIVRAGERLAFKYGLNGSRKAAGALESDEAATEAHTNLENPSVTNNNEIVQIHGISAHPSVNADPELYKALSDALSFELTIGQSAPSKLGRLEMLPSPYGVSGKGRSRIRAGAMNEPFGAPVDFYNNGLPVPGQMLKVDPIKWYGIGSAGSDTSLVLKAKLPSDITIQGIERPGAVEGQATFVAPPTIRVDLVLTLHCKRESMRSTNS